MSGIIAGVVVALLLASTSLPFGLVCVLSFVAGFVCQRVFQDES